MPPAGFEPTIPASERPQTLALYSVATGTGSESLMACVSQLTAIYVDLLNPKMFFILKIS